MVGPKAKRQVHPVILARAKELRRPMTPQESKLWQRFEVDRSAGASSGGSIRWTGLFLISSVPSAG
jgi:hypothetical protein